MEIIEYYILVDIGLLERKWRKQRVRQVMSDAEWYYQFAVDLFEEE